MGPLFGACQWVIPEVDTEYGIKVGRAVCELESIREKTGKNRKENRGQSRLSSRSLKHGSESTFSVSLLTSSSERLRRKLVGEEQQGIWGRSELVITSVNFFSLRPTAFQVRFVPPREASVARVSEAHPGQGCDQRFNSNTAETRSMYSTVGCKYDERWMRDPVTSTRSSVVPPYPSSLPERTLLML